MTAISLFLLAAIIALSLLILKKQKGEDLRIYDGTNLPLMKKPNDISPAHNDLSEYFISKGKEPRPKSQAELLIKTRLEMDSMFDDLEHNCQITPLEFDGMQAEWVCSEHSDPNRRLLYLHGGAFMFGSPRSHRPLTTYMAEKMGLSVLAIDYRLMPENRRLDGIEDCQKAWQYIIDNGPNITGKATDYFVAGDSAGGSLCLMIAAWAENNSAVKPSAVIAFSPTTDSGLTSPSLKNNIDTDPMLAPLLKKIKYVPLPLLSAISAQQMKASVFNPLVSPVRGSLSKLPPILIQASRDETLIDDSIRYFNKAKQQGNDITLQMWPKMVHVWQIFHHQLPEGVEALEKVKEFIDSHSQH